MRIISLFVFAVLAATACTTESTNRDHKRPETAQSIIDSAVFYAFDGDLKSRELSFEFRGRNYSAAWNSGRVYTSTYIDSAGSHRRVLDDNGYREFLNKAELELDVKQKSARSASVNSVLYFALLPFHLLDGAVQPSLLGPDTLDGKVYHKIEVRFAQEGGGEDFEDVFYYWFDQTDYSLDFLAYSYFEDEGGTRFRKAENRRKVNGVTFQDYLNFKGPSSPDSLKYIGEMYKANELELLSEIKLSQLIVR